MATLRSQRHLVTGGPDEPSGLRIHLERRPRIDRLGGGVRRDLGQCDEQFAGTGGDDELIQPDTEAVGQSLTQRQSRIIGVERGVRRMSDHGVEDGRQRGQKILVRGELV